MRPHFLLNTTCLALATFAGTAASAAVTSADVWDSYVSFYEATGAEVTGTPETSGDTTVVTGSALVYRLPFGIATLRMDLPDLTMTDQADGTVALSYPESFDLQVSVDVPDQGSGSGTFSVSQTGYTGLASGDPGVVTFAQSAETMRISASDLDLPESVTGTDDTFAFQMEVLSQGYSTTSTVTSGDLIAVTGEATLGAADVAYIMSSGAGDTTSNTAQYGQSESTLDMALPAGGSNVFNLSQVLQDGAFIRGTSVSNNNSSETVTSIDGEVISEQSTATGVSNATFGIDASGASLSADAMDTTFSMLIPLMIPVPIEGALERISGSYQIPLLPSDEAQDAALQLSLENLTISDALWDMLDPNAELPRDPASLSIDVAARVLSDIDWLNFSTLEAQLNQPVPPIAPESVIINDLSLSAVGASVKGSGAFTLDMEDTQTFAGFPRPEGDAIIEVSGANTLIDRLTTLGIIGPEEAGMARLGIGFAARSTGDDSFETVVEVNEEGHVMVNGQRMR